MVVIVSLSFSHAVRRNKINKMFNVFIVVVLKNLPLAKNKPKAGNGLVDD